MRVLALDVGDKRIGLALSDPTGLLATPLTTIERSNQERDVAEVVRLAQEHEAVRILVGMPFLMSGRAGPQAHATRDFVRALAGATDIPIDTRDERLSSVQAERMLRDSGSQPSRDRAMVDAAAAAVILQSYLDSIREEDGPGS